MTKGTYCYQIKPYVTLHNFQIKKQAVILRLKCKVKQKNLTDNMWLQPTCDATDKEDGIWLGITYLQNEAVWKIWNNPQELKYDNWSLGQPNTTDGSQNCAHMWCLYQNGEWDDYNCDAVNQNTICEFILPQY